MPLFTPGQQRIFDQISKDPYIRDNFYFTGGTALSYFYLRHRYSEDLDFFSGKPVDDKKILEIMHRIAVKADFTFRAELKEVVYMFFIKFKDGEELKVDFGYYPYRRVKKGKVSAGFEIDSLLDIGINKLASINQRSSVKDFVDLYYLWDKLTVWDLIEGVKVKFRMEIDYWILGQDISFTIEKFDSMPRMIKPLSLVELKQFFREKAVELGRKVVK